MDLRLPTSHHHDVAHSCRRTRRDLPSALLPHPPDPTHPIGRTAHSAAQLSASALAVAGDRPLHEASARAPSGSPHTTHGPSRHPFPATALGSWLHSALHE